MCRYAMTTYKSHYACFNCRKTFKRRLLSDINGGQSKDEKESPAKCPECSSLMANMGLDFESPKKTDIKAWNHISTLYKVGITFHSCGCSGPGYIPNDSKALINYFEKIKEHYLEHQHFWAQRKKDPEIQCDIAKDEYQNATFLYRIPKEMKKGSKKKPKYDARNAQIYWNERVVQIEEKIEKVKILTL
ncbi:hypothetical protein [Flavivirga eckloniae]|uniref:Uncharacterized protein n=1 Tax=Flavivirga eckloniae TaxID=1803846 RepID=A0A2K9PQA0_9FLAO|nr:hypothetical protein [Flavivirga eckloniae]AUP79219.1 hypothetical protein C1H87_11095 [Flavivirga eckloniae]